jgi:hypothetical protein
MSPEWRGIYAFFLCYFLKGLNSQMGSDAVMDSLINWSSRSMTWQEIRESSPSGLDRKHELFQVFQLPVLEHKKTP